MMEFHDSVLKYFFGSPVKLLLFAAAGQVIAVYARVIFV